MYGLWEWDETEVGWHVMIIPTIQCLNCTLSQSMALFNPAWFYCFSIAVEVLTLHLTRVQTEQVSSSNSPQTKGDESETFALCQYQTCHEFGLSAGSAGRISAVYATQNIHLELTWLFVSPGWEESVRSSNHAPPITFSWENAVTGERSRSSGGIRLKNKRTWPKSYSFMQTVVNCCTCIVFLHSPVSKIRSRGNTVYLS